MRRRNLIKVAGVVCVTGGAGCMGFFEDGPDDVAEEFIEHIDDGEFAEADRLIHSDSTVEGAGQAADLIGAIYGVDSVVDALEISVQGSEVLNEDGDAATVRVMVEVHLIVDQLENEIEIDMRQEDGEWRIWLLGSG